MIYVIYQKYMHTTMLHAQQFGSIWFKNTLNDPQQDLQLMSDCQILWSLRSLSILEPSHPFQEANHISQPGNRMGAVDVHTMAGMVHVDTHFTSQL